MNMVVLSGNIGSEPEFRHYDSGKRRGSFSVALDQYGKEGEKTEAFWLVCYAWDSVCDRLQRCQKSSKLSGRKINLAGTLTQSSWTDTVTGEKKSRVFVNVQMLDLFPASRILALNQPDQEPRSDAEMIFEGKPLFPARKRFTRKPK